MWPAAPAVGVRDDFGDREAGDNGGRAKDKVVEIEEGGVVGGSGRR